MTWTSRRRAGTAVTGAGALLLALAGCSGDSGHGSAEAAAGPAVTTAATPTSVPTPTPTLTPTPVAACTDTSAYTQKQLHDYLKTLPNSNGASHTGLYTDYDGVYYEPAFEHRPCQVPQVSVTQFWVTLDGSSAGRPTPGGSWTPTWRPAPTIPTFPGQGDPGATPDDSTSLFTYSLIGTTPLALTPGPGSVANSAPPFPEYCKGTLTVLHLGEAVKEAELPDSLSFKSRLGVDRDHGASQVTVNADRVIDATLVAPKSSTGC
ncbi:hypothetical protein [Kitasatospora indigofera]|uniref:hypothetical protein n=1 Tax=Kitasatospora indigofera TaxID=67307 RepID=UPI003626715D